MQKKRQLMLIMHQSLSSLLFPGYRRRVLGLLLLHPEEALHGREIARRTGLPQGTLTRELNRLAAAGLLTREARGNQVAFAANKACPVYEELASILRKTSGMADVLAEALAAAGDAVDVAFVFGSMARGKESAGSDVDVIAIGQLGFRQAVELLYPAQATLGRDINPKVFSPTEWRKRAAANDAFVKDVLAKPKIFLVGTNDDLEELARDKPRGGRAKR
jgi:predicted nucleotidyltransferase